MKRIEQLQDLSREHHQSLTLAKKAVKISDAKNDEAIAELCQEIVKDYSETWAVHFKIEEDSIFQLFFESDINQEITDICHQLVQEHQTMTAYYEQMKAGDYSILGDFGLLLKLHTRKEERELFPLLEEVMTSEQLDKVNQTSQNYRPI